MCLRFFIVIHLHRILFNIWHELFVQGIYPLGSGHLTHMIPFIGHAAVTKRMR